MTDIVFKILISYLIGSIPFSIIAGKILKGIDIRKHGSGNAGATNTFRVLGWKAGAIVTLLDILKGVIATLWITNLNFFTISTNIDFEVLKVVCGFSAIIGHIWTIFAGFRGGKGVATASGMLIGLYPLPMLFGLSVFALVLISSKYVSLSSMIGAASVPFILFLSKVYFNHHVSDFLFYFSIVIAILIVFTHRANIKRLINGTEYKVGQKKEAI